MTKEKKAIQEESFAKLPSTKEMKEFWGTLKSFLFATSLEKSKYFIDVKKDIKQQVSKPVKFALWTIAFTIFFFVIWGGLAPLDSAITAQGSIVFSGNRQIIQHDTGGIIKNILVKDGDLVNEGQPLIELNPSHVATSVNITLSQLRTTTAVEKRLLAEETGKEDIDFHSEYLDFNNPEVIRLIENQRQLFDVRREMLKGKLESMSKQIEQAEEKIVGEKGHLKSVQSQLASARANASDAEQLFKKEAVPKTYLMQARSQVQQLEGEESRIKASIAMTEKSIIDGKIQLLNVKNDFMNRIEEEYKQNHIMLLEAEQKYLQAREMLDRTTIKAPVTGIVSSMVYHTIGGVISPGVKIMEINPQDDDLIVDSYVSPNEIGSLRVGIPVKIQLNPYKQRLVPRIEGEVIYVSANTIVHEQARQEFYLVKVKIDKDVIDKLNADVKLYPGMPVTVFIIRGTRTFLQYFLSPIIDSFHRAFKEA
jgi:HlyD family type I secretion membrane fusion protein